jgi:hypothetical protein
MGYQHLPKCGAYARSAGRPCQHCAMANGRCYYHGGSTPVKHGKYTKQAMRARKETRGQIKTQRNDLIVLKLDYNNGY